MSDATALRSTPAGSRRRFWLTVLLFACANFAAWVGYHQYNISRLHLLRVVRFDPGQDAIVGPRPTFTWQFNLDVAHDLAAIGSAGAPPPGTITPRIAGKWLWHDGRTLTFTPEADLPRATQFKIALTADRLRTPQGISLDKPFIQTFSTERLHVIAARQCGFDENARLVVELEFDDAVLPTDVAAHLTLKDTQWQLIGFHQHGQASGKIIRVQTDPVPQLRDRAGEAFIFAQLTPGLAGAGGPLPMLATFAQKLPVAADLMATQVTATAERRGGTAITIHFNADDVDPVALRQVLSVEPPITFQVTRDYRGLRLLGAFEPGTRYAVKIDKAPAGADARRYPRPDVLSVFVPDRTREVWFEHADGYLGSQGNRALLAHAVNVAAARVTVTRMYDSNLVIWRNATGGGGDRWDDPSAYARPLVSRTLPLAGAKNKVQDLRLALDDLLPADAPRDGVYRIGLSAADASPSQQQSIEDADADADDRPAGSSSAVVTLSDIGLTAKQARGGVSVWAVSLATARPLPNIRVRLFSSKNQFLAEARTDTEGLAKLANFHPARGEHAAVLLAEMIEPAAERLAGDAQPAAATIANSLRNLTWLDLRNESLNFANFDVAGKPYLRSGYEAFLYTERGVYRPGETAHLRAIVRGPDTAVPVQFPVRWQLRRPDLRDWRSQLVTLDADGCASLDVPLPDDLPTGRWTADLAIPGENGTAGHSFGSVAFQIEEFIPNRMKIHLDVPAAHGDRIALAGEPFVATIQADYLFGKPAADRPAKLTARIDPAPFGPPQWSGWTFNDTTNVAEALDGPQTIGGRIELPESTLDSAGHARWQIAAADLLRPPSSNLAPRHPKRSAAAAAAAATVPATHPSRAYAGPWRITLFAAVTEGGGRAVNATRVIDADLLQYYLAVRPVRSFSVPGDPIRFDLAAVSPDGSLASAANGRCSATLYREIWNTSLVHEDGHYRYISTRKLEPASRVIPTTLTAGRGSIEITPPSEGAFVLLVRDDRVGCATSRHFFCGAGAWQDNVNREHPEQLEIVLSPAPPRLPEMLRTVARRFDAATAFRLWHGRPLMPTGETKYRPGDTMRALVRAPFAGRLLLAVESDSVLCTRVLDMPASHATVPIELPADCRPGAFVTATVIRPIDPNAAWRTHRAFGIARIPIDNTNRKLSLHIDAPAETRPERTLQVAVRVTDASGTPVPGAAVTVAAVDEGILALTNYLTPDPFAFFTAGRAHGVRWSDLYGRLMPEVPKPDGASPVGGDKADGDDAPSAARHQTPVTARRVKPVALLSAALHADAAGIVHADFPIPQFSGQLRVMAIACAGPSVGSADVPVFVRSPLLVQSSWPRFAAPDDRFAVPLIVFNNSRSPGPASITVELAAGPLEFEAAGDRRLTLTTGPIPAGGQASLNVKLRAALACGVARARLSARLGDESYSEDVEFPIRPASPMISVGGYAIAKPTDPVQIAPATATDFVQGTARFELRVTSFPSLELPQGLEYLDRYPYGCAEQTISGCFPLVALGDFGPQLAPGIFGRQRIEDKFQSGIMHLLGMQTADGGLAMWPAGPGSQSWPWASVYAAHLLVEAQAAGHKVPDDFRDHLLAYIRGLLNEATDKPEMVEVQAYACYVLAQSGKPPRSVMSRLTEILNDAHSPRADRPAIATEARFHLAAAWLAAGRRDLAAGLIPQALPQPRDARRLSGNLGSPVRERAVLLSTLLAIQPDHPAIPALAQQIADAARPHGWRSTQDAAFAVMALGKYLRQLKQSEPYETAIVTTTAATEPFARVSAGQSIAIDSPFIAGDKLDLRITGPAASRAYVSWLATGVPLTPPPDEDAGLKVRRRYLDAVGKPIKSATVQSGDLLQVELTLDTPTALENVVIDDLLPAGLEIENARLATAADAAQTRRDDATPRTSALSLARTDIRDDRLIVVVGSLPLPGPATFTYLVRATTPGTFTVPPVRAECMYDIATHSLWAGASKLTIVPAEPSPPPQRASEHPGE